MMFPVAVPEVPVASIDKAAAHYVDVFVSPSTGEMNKAVLQVSPGEAADCFSRTPIFESITAIWAPCFFGSISRVKAKLMNSSENGSRLTRGSSRDLICLLLYI